MTSAAWCTLPRRRLLAGAAASAMIGVQARAAQSAIEVLHWWTAGGEAQAIRTIRRKLEAAGQTWVDTAVQVPDVAKAAAMTRILGGNPPTVMLWHAGLDLRDLWRDQVIRDIQPVASAQNWDAVLPKEIANRLKVEGRYVAIPADLHCGNWMFAHNRLMRDAGVEVPTTWPAVLDACQKLQASGVIPIAFGGQAWQETSVFVQIMAGTGGIGLARRFIADHDPAASDSAEMVESFATFARLKPFVDKASPNRSATDTANLLVSNRAALHFAGDWARGDLKAGGMQADVDYTCRSGPGNNGIFMAVVDAFCLPRIADPAVSAAQEAFAQVTMSAESQHDFNLLKGSIPVRNDVDLAGYDPCALMAARLSRGEGEVIPSSSMGMTTAMRLAMYEVVHRFWNTDGADPKAAARDLRIAIERNRA